ELATKIAAFQVPAVPQLFVDDITPEALSRTLRDQGGRILQASAEGTAFEIIKGRYTDKPNFDVYLKGHAGDPLRINRVTRETELVDDPALSLALAVQPDVIRGLGENASLKARGLLARPLYSIPVSTIGSRTIGAPAVPTDVSDQFHQNMIALW